MLPAFVPEIVARLRRCGIPLGVDDIEALRLALAAGFGWRSSQALRELCVSLWAKSTAEATIVRATFASLSVPEWDLGPAEPSPPPGGRPASGPATAAPGATGGGDLADGGQDVPRYDPDTPPTTQAHIPARHGGTPLPPSGVDDPTLVLIPRYPLGARAVAQVWRRMRRPVRHGPAVVLDVAETVRRRAALGVPTPPVLVPARRNAARLFLLVDSGGSMTPYQGFVNHVLESIRRAARLDHLRVYYLHDVPGHTDRAVLAGTDGRQPDLDRLLADIPPLCGGRVYRDAELTRPEPLAGVVARLGPMGARSTGVCVVSDAGAARGRLDTVRLLDTIALLKSLSGHPICWLNPVDPGRWPRSTAALVARHVPMFPLTVAGMYAAVDVLRGRVRPVERPL